MSLSSAMRGVDDAPQLKTLAFQNLVSGCPKGNILHGLLESPTTAQTALLEKLTDEQVQVLQTICASQAAISVIWSPPGTGKSWVLAALLGLFGKALSYSDLSLSFLVTGRNARRASLHASLGHFFRPANASF